MTELVHRRMQKLLTIALAAMWLATLACTDAAFASSQHFPHRRMPCCPRSGTPGAQCSPDQCAGGAFQKSDAGYAGKAPALHRTAAPLPSIPQPSLWSSRAWMPGLCFRAAVFRLKDDLRI